MKDNRFALTGEELELLDRFAGTALTGLLAGLYSGENVNDHKKGVAHLAYEYAVAMLESRRALRSEIYPK